MDPRSPAPFSPPGFAVPLAVKKRQTAAGYGSSNPWGVPPAPQSNARNGLSGDTSIFSTSLPVLPHEKLISPDSAHATPLVMDDASAKLKDFDHDPLGNDDYKFDFDLRQIDDLLPDEDDLFAGITNEIEPSAAQPNNPAEELEEFDVFGSGGGMELDSDPLESITSGLGNTSIGDGLRGSNGVNNNFGLSNSPGAVAGEHPFGEHPSRTLFVRNINSNVEDSELRSLFEQFGDIRTLYTATKHRGFVMISYFDIRAARGAMRSLQNKPLRRRKLDIHFSIPKENPSDKDLNQGTLVIFNLDPSVSNEEVRQIFGAYGEVKEIRETPNKKHHKFIEFYDVRAAEAALRSLNKSEIAGKRIKLEPSRPGGTRRSLVQQLGHELEQDEPRGYRNPHVGSPMANSPPGVWTQYGSPTDSNLLQAFNNSPTGNGMSPIGISPSMMSNAMKIAPIGKDSNWSKYDQVFSNSNHSLGAAFQHSQSYQDHKSEHMSSSPGTLTGPEFLWGSPKPYPEHSQPSMWRPPSIGHAMSSSSRPQGQGFLYGSRQASLFGSSDQNRHHVGSAPSGAPFESHFGFLPESPETSFMNQVRFGNIGNIGTNRNGGGLMMNMASRASLNPVSSLSGSLSDNNSANFRPILSSPRLSQPFFGNPTYQGPGYFGLDSSMDRGRNRRVDSSVFQADSKKQYQLDLEKIRKGEDTRTTLMIKNIPNKYTSKMLLAAIDELHKGTYDFFYLPIDFKNKCNVGYAFINMISPVHIISFYQAFNGKKWEKFNSEKVASLAYGRIQGRNALISHFQNSSLMNEDKRCRPILFHSNGPETGNQEPFPNGICIHMPLDGGAVASREPLGYEEDDNPNDKMAGESSMMGSL
ncbi:protein MEI2-like 2 [Lolium rigidum]|uniref:protein MEI2-like 2 n=1 Tax=Lolium rigidum TaxID=89674 RepID=UPI001F5C95A2|nr:protein MEI2-like 2 [Lolium rigidum]